MATPTPDYNQLVANLLTRRDELKSALREAEAELEEIEDFLDALDSFFDRVPPGKIKPTKTVPNHQLWAYSCKFCQACTDGVVCKNPEINHYSCVLFYGDDQTHCCGWEAKKDND